MLTRPSSPDAPLEALLPTVDPTHLASAPAPAPLGPAEIVVHVAGAVHRPGLVSVEVGARVADAIVGAGGALLDADLDRINLAAPLADAERIHVPLVGEDPVRVVGAEDERSDQGPVDLNTASEAQLDELPGIGPATAAAIVSYRSQHGDFTSVTSLLEVPGIGPAKLERLRGLVTVTP